MDAVSPVDVETVSIIAVQRFREDTGAGNELRL
jgi:hypothetical protein